MDEGHEDNNQYVNYQVGFEYTRPESAKKMGHGLHVLSYFGVGVKGVGASEVPVYCDVVSIQGTVRLHIHIWSMAEGCQLNLRLLLTPTPPFARNATFSFPVFPEFEVSAKPLVSSSFNAMGIPGVRSYVHAAIADVVSAFVRPHSYSLDLDRLLLGREASLRTDAIGVLQISIHGAHDLLRADTMGSCDPYVAISYAKYHKPLYSTRTVVDNQNPIWNETAFLLVTEDAISADERLRLRVCDADRMSADDAIGVVELELVDIMGESVQRRLGEEVRRKDELRPDRPGMKTSGHLEWSVRFCSIRKTPFEEIERQMREKNGDDPKKGEPPPSEPPWWLNLVSSIAEGKPKWEEAES